MDLTHYVGNSIESVSFSEMLDPAVPDRPVEDAMSLVKLALQCAELRRKDRPDLTKVVLPELNRLRESANEILGSCPIGGRASVPPSPNHNNASTTQDAGGQEQIHSEEQSSKSNTGSSSPTEEAPGTEN